MTKLTSGQLLIKNKMKQFLIKLGYALLIIGFILFLGYSGNVEVKDKMTINQSL